MSDYLKEENKKAAIAQALIRLPEEDFVELEKELGSKIVLFDTINHWAVIDVVLENKDEYEITITKRRRKK